MDLEWQSTLVVNVRLEPVAWHYYSKTSKSLSDKMIGVESFLDVVIFCSNKV